MSSKASRQAFSFNKNLTMCFLWSAASTSSAAAGCYKTALVVHLGLLLTHQLLLLLLFPLGHLPHLVQLSLGLLYHQLAHLALLGHQALFLICFLHPVLLVAHLVLLVAHLVLPGLPVAHLDRHLLNAVISQIN